MKAKVIKVKKNLVGKSVPTNQHGHAGRAIEVLLEQEGFDINRGKGVDLVKENIEVKSRDESAISPHTTVTMTLTEIKQKIWDDSVVKSKLQQQLRFTTKDGKIIKQELIDLSDPQLQAFLKDAYDTCRQKIINGNTANTIHGNKFGYFEKVRGTKESYQFRHSNGGMKKIINSTKSTFTNLIEYI